MSAPLVNAERTQSERCVNAELNMVNDEWTMSERITRKERKRELKANSERTVNTKLKIYLENLGCL